MNDSKKSNQYVNDYLDPYIRKEAGTQEIIVGHMEAATSVNVPFERRNFFKIVMITNGEIIIHIREEEFFISKPAVFFVNPFIPYSFQSISETYSGYFCIFTKDFIGGDEQTATLQHSPLFDLNLSPFIHITKSQVSTLTKLFQNMLIQEKSDYKFKKYLLKNYLHIIVHEFLIRNPGKTNHTSLSINSSGRIAAEFYNLLESQFPILSETDILKLKKPSDFAQRLFVHVNHLNRVLHSIFGKSTGVLINERIFKEAQRLLTSTIWSINEIAYVLGFEYPSYFDRFFKKYSKISPVQYRQFIV